MFCDTMLCYALLGHIVSYHVEYSKFELTTQPPPAAAAAATATTTTTATTAAMLWNQVADNAKLPKAFESSISHLSV